MIDSSAKPSREEESAISCAARLTGIEFLFFVNQGRGELQLAVAARSGISKSWHSAFHNKSKNNREPRQGKLCRTQEMLVQPLCSAAETRRRGDA